MPLLPLPAPLPAGTCGGTDRAPTWATDRAASFRVATGAAGRGDHTTTATIAAIAATAAVPRLCLDVGEGATGGTTGTTGTTISLGPEERSPDPTATNTAAHPTTPTAATLILAALPTFATFAALGQRPRIFVHLEREERQRS